MFKDTDSSDRKLAQKSKTELVQVLHDLISELEEEEVRFLVRQAQVLRYNRKVRAVNETIKASKSGSDAKKKSRGSAKSPQSRSKQHEVEIVERGDGKHFFIVVRGFRIYFTLDEMKKLVKICQVADDASDATIRLYNWLKRFRSDFLVDGSIGSAGNPYLVDLYRKLIASYKVQGED